MIRAVVRLAAVALLVAVLFVPAAVAQQDVFEVVVSGIWAPEACLIVPRIHPALQWFSPDRLDLDSAPGITAIASPDHRRVFGILAVNRVVVVTTSLSGVRTPFFDGLPGAISQSIAVAPGGRVFVRYLQAGMRRIAVISAAGALEATYALPNQGTGNAIAVASDGCTIYYAAGGVIACFDACTGTALSDFAMVAANDFALLPDGSAVVTSGSDVRLYNAGGAFERILANVIALGFPPDYIAVSVAVTADGERLYVTAEGVCTDPAFRAELNFETGALLSRRELTMTSSFDIVAGAGAAAIPTASETALLALAITLALAALSILKR
jgi:hypothetical protein